LSYLLHHCCWPTLNPAPTWWTMWGPNDPNHGPYHGPSRWKPAHRWVVTSMRMTQAKQRARDCMRTKPHPPLDWNDNNAHTHPAEG
jgi:hypothetical protein